jgi:hypothetical protein
LTVDCNALQKYTTSLYLRFSFLSPSKHTYHDIMRVTTTPIALLALPALIHATTVKLADFVPRVTDVSDACNKVYTQVITGCESTDFTQKSCSVACVKGLTAMTKSVKDACSGQGLLADDKKDGNVLSMFLQDNGPKSLCANADDVLQSGSSVASTTHSSTTSNPSNKGTSSSTKLPSTLIVDTSTSPQHTKSTSITSTEENSASTATDASTLSSQIFEAPSMPSTWASASSTPTVQSEHSGGGSPFDAEGNQYSAAAAISSSAVMLITAGVFAVLAAR